jgi:hypothetical protein
MVDKVKKLSADAQRILETICWINKLDLPEKGRSSLCVLLNYLSKNGISPTHYISQDIVNAFGFDLYGDCDRPRFRYQEKEEVKIIVAFDDLNEDGENPTIFIEVELSQNNKQTTIFIMCEYSGNNGLTYKAEVKIE